MRRVPLILFVVVVLGLAAPSSNAETSKIDPLLRFTLSTLRAGSASTTAQAQGLSVGRDGLLDVFIRGDVSRHDLEAAGVRVRTALPGLLTADLPIAAVERVAGLPGIVRISGAVRAEAELDVSVPTTTIDQQRFSGPDFNGANGAGVLIGNVDSGVSFDHGDFDDASGNTRLVGIWDQTELGTPPLGYLYGNECSPAQIDAGTCSQTAIDGHGTHVLGIAGGDGSLTGGSVPAYTYVGMAPRADLIAVKTTFSTTAIVDGVNYIFDKATARAQNAVVNLSLGSQYGPHDGTSDFESALDALAGSGRIIVKSGGNDRAQFLHAERIAGVGDSVATMSVNGSVVGRFFQIAGYYESTENLSVTIQTPGGTTVGPIFRGSHNGTGQDTPEGQVTIDNGTIQTAGGAYELFIDVRAVGSDNMNGVWSFHFTPQGLGAANGEIDLWRFATSSAALNAFFQNGLQNEELISEPGNAPQLITTAAWVSTQSWRACNDVLSSFSGQPAPGFLATFSSPGPTRDGRMKPDIAAPGTAIGAARSLDTFASCPPAVPPSPSQLLKDNLNHIMMSGTSMAAPHVAGAAALLMQKMGALTPTQVKNHLIANAVTDVNTGSVWNEDWGYGKLRVGDLVDPSAVVLSPDGGESYEIGQNVTLTWFATDTFGGVTEVDILLSRSGSGGPFETIALSEVNDGTFDWTVTGPGTHVGPDQMFNAYLKVVSRDDAGNEGEDISASGFSIFDPTPTLLSLFRGHAGDGGVELYWQFANPGAIAQTAVERSETIDGPWQRLTGAPREAQGLMVFVDDTAAPGRVYHYRLIAETYQDERLTFGPLSVTSGAPIAAFALTQIAPNPTHGITRFEFTVPRAAPVRLVIVDVLGREVATLAEGVHQTGRYQAAWSGEARGRLTAPGLYFVRFEVPGQRVTRRLAVVR